MDYDFVIKSVSIIPLGGSYFVGMIKILKEFGIPLMIISDSDILLNIKDTINFGSHRIKTSSLFSQMNDLNFLNDDDKSKLMSF